MAARLGELLAGVRRERFRFLAPDWYERKYGISSRDAARHYRLQGYKLGYAPTPIFDVDWYEARYGRGDAPPLAVFEREAWKRQANRWLNPATLLAAGAAKGDVVDLLAAARIDLGDPRTLLSSAAAIIHEWPGRRSVGRGEQVVVLAHYDPSGLDESFVAQVTAFVAAGREVVVCSTSLDDGTVSALLDNVVAVCRVPNTGLDWGSYQAGLGYVVERFEPGAVLLANDSVYVVPDRLGAFLDRLDDLPADLAGATDSTQFGTHVQSYLLRLASASLHGPLVGDLLTHYVPIASKELTIHTYELGFSRRALEHGLQIGAVHPEAWLLETTLRASAATPERSPADRRGKAGGADAASLAAAARRRLSLREATADPRWNSEPRRPPAVRAGAHARARGGGRPTKRGRRCQSNRQRTSVRSTRRPSRVVSFLPSSRERALYVIGTS